MPGILGVAFVSSTVLLYAFAALLGFFLVAVLPLGMQYAAEITTPTPEGTSNGLIQLCGQVSVVSVYIMAALRTSNGSFTVSLLLAGGTARRLRAWCCRASRTRRPWLASRRSAQRRPSPAGRSMRSRGRSPPLAGE